MRLSDLNRRIGAIENALAATGHCSTCHGMGNLGPFPLGMFGSQDISPACLNCGAVARRQHIVGGVSQADLDAMFRPSPTQHATLSVWRNI